MPTGWIFSVIKIIAGTADPIFNVIVIYRQPAALLPLISAILFMLSLKLLIWLI
jgi:hypothetical protein